MRTTKFRGQKTDTGEWVFGDLVNVRDSDTSRYYPCIVISYNHDSFDWIEVKPETAGQFTGLLDKNGKDIYEGDIISLKYTPVSDAYLGSNPRWYKSEATVVFDGLCFKGKNNIKWGKNHNSRNFQYFFLTDWKVSDIEIIETV